MSGSPTRRSGSTRLACSKVIPFDRLVVGPARDAELDDALVPLEGTLAKLNIVRRTPAAQNARARRTRGWKRPDLEEGLVFIEWMDARRRHACRRHRSMPRKAFRSVGLRV